MTVWPEALDFAPGAELLVASSADVSGTGGRWQWNTGDWCGDGLLGHSYSAVTTSLGAEMSFYGRRAVCPQIEARTASLHAHSPGRALVDLAAFALARLKGLFSPEAGTRIPAQQRTFFASRADTSLPHTADCWSFVSGVGAVAPLWLWMALSEDRPGALLTAATRVSLPTVQWYHPLLYGSVCPPRQTEWAECPQRAGLGDPRSVTMWVTREKCVQACGCEHVCGSTCM